MQSCSIIWFLNCVCLGRLQPVTREMRQAGPLQPVTLEMRQAGQGPAGVGSLGAEPRALHCDHSCASEGPQLARALGADRVPSLSVTLLIKTCRVCPAVEQMRWLHSARSISSAPIGASLWNVGGEETHLFHTHSHLQPQTSVVQLPRAARPYPASSPGCQVPGTSCWLKPCRPGTPAALFRVRGPH